MEHTVLLHPHVEGGVISETGLIEHIPGHRRPRHTEIMFESELVNRIRKQIRGNKIVAARELDRDPLLALLATSPTAATDLHLNTGVNNTVIGHRRREKQLRPGQHETPPNTAP